MVHPDLLALLDGPLLATVFAATFVAQLPGKSAMAAAVLATRYRPGPVLAGAAAALAIHSVIAVAAGSVLTLLPPRPVHVAAGAIFLVAAFTLWRRREDEASTEEEATARGPAFRQVAGSSFAVVFVAEWGDLTQFSTAALSARYARPVTVLVGAILGLWAATAIAIGLGRGARRVIGPARMQKVAAIVFAVIGAVLLARSLWAA